MAQTPQIDVDFQILSNCSVKTATMPSLKMIGKEQFTSAKEINATAISFITSICIVQGEITVNRITS